MTKTSEYGLIGDIGGTNARFGLSPVGRGRPTEKDLLDIKTLKCTDYPTIEEAIRSYISGMKGSAMPTKGCLALAGPVTGSIISLTNKAWRFSKEDVRESLGFSALTFINDYHALVIAVPYLERKGVLKIGHGLPVQGKPIAVIGPGSGLGVSGSVHTPSGPVTIDSEGGHIGFAPLDAFEIDIAAVLEQRFGRVSNERLLSGPGIENLYQAITRLRGMSGQERSAPEICSEAVAGTCEACIEALERFCGILGSVAGDIALAMGAQGGVYIAGGIVPRFVDFFKSSAFRYRFEEKGRFRKYMAAIPTFLIISRHPGLLGAAILLNQHLQR